MNTKESLEFYLESWDANLIEIFLKGICSFSPHSLDKHPDIFKECLTNREIISITISHLKKKRKIIPIELHYAGIMTIDEIRVYNDTIRK